MPCAKAMTYSDAIQFLYNLRWFGAKFGLTNTFRLAELAGNPHRQLRFIHVAGTNGKGSVCAMLDSILRASGRRTGLYTSPHLVDFRERIRVDGEKIPPQNVANGLTILREISAGWSHSPTFFEISTALALPKNAATWSFATGMGAGCWIVPLVWSYDSGPYAMAWGHAGRDRERKGRNCQIWRACRQCRTSARGRRSAGPACGSCGFIPGIYPNTF